MKLEIEATELDKSGRLITCRYMAGGMQRTLTTIEDGNIYNGVADLLEMLKLVTPNLLMSEAEEYYQGSFRFMDSSFAEGINDGLYRDDEPRYAYSEEGEE